MKGKEMEKVNYEKAVEIIEDAGKNGFVGITCVRKTDAEVWRWVKDPSAIGADGKKARPRPKRSACILWVKDRIAEKGDEYTIIVESAGQFAKSGVKGIIPPEVRKNEDFNNKVLTVFSPSAIRKARRAEEVRLKEARKIYEYIKSLGEIPTALEEKEILPKSEEEIASEGWRRIDLSPGQIIKIVAGGETRILEIV